MYQILHVEGRMEGRFTAEPKLALDCRNRLGESIIWDDRAGLLYWTNIHDREIWAWDPMAGGVPRVVAMPERVGALGLRESGGLVLALERGFARLGPALDDLVPIADVPDGRDDNRLNDGRVGPGGRFVCGGMSEAVPQLPVASLYSLSGDGAVETLLSGIVCCNSLCWSPAGTTLYFTDMPTRRIEAFDYDARTGRIAGRRLFAQLPNAQPSPDGSIVDAEGCLWNAEWEGGRLVRYRPDGSVDRAFAVPVTNPTCMAFGGPDLDILFVTSATFLLGAERQRAEPQAGGLYAFRPGPRGLRERRFVG